MKRIIARRPTPTPATAIACIALFVALGGVSYGVATNSIDTREIADNTVRSKDIRNNGIYSNDLRNNEIRTVDIRNNAIRGRDIATNTVTDDQVDESKLQQVPSAADAARLGGRLPADFAAVPEPVRLIGASGQPPFENGATTASVTDPPSLAAGFWKDGSGVVHLQGAFDSPGAVTNFTLPTGYRPAGRVRYVVPVGTGLTDTVEVNPNGTVVTAIGGDPYHLDGIGFRAAATP